MAHVPYHERLPVELSQATGRVPPRDLAAIGQFLCGVPVGASRRDLGPPLRKPGLRAPTLPPLTPELLKKCLRLRADALDADAPGNDAPGNDAPGTGSAHANTRLHARTLQFHIRQPSSASRVQEPGRSRCCARPVARAPAREPRAVRGPGGPQPVWATARPAPPVHLTGCGIRSWLPSWWLPARPGVRAR